MKFDLIIKDATADEIRAFLSGAAITSLGKDTFIGGTALATTGLVTAIDGTVYAPNAPGNLQGLPNTPGHQQVMAMPDDDNGAPNTNAPAVDSQGMPHDARIHSDNKGLNKDGSWRKRRGVNDAMVAAVESELKLRALSQMPNTQPTHQQPNAMPHQQIQQPNPGNGQVQYAPPPNAMPHQMQHQPDGNGQVQYAPPNQMQNGNGQVQYAPPAPTAMDFTQFMANLSNQMMKRDVNGVPLITTEYLAGLAQRLAAHHGRQINSITDISSDPMLIASAVAFINADGRWQ